MDESEENMSSEDMQSVDSPITVKIKPKKRSLVERELETNLTARVTSPVTSEGSNTSRYGRARRLKTGAEIDMEKFTKPLRIDVSKTQPQAYKMHASNSPISKESPKKTISVGSTIEDQIENIYNENISLSRFGSEEKAKSQSPAKKFSKVYVRKDLIQKPDTDTVVLIKNLFSPNKPNTHINNILERSSEKYGLNGHGKSWNGFPDTSSVVKTLDFDGKKKKDVKEKVASKNEMFDIEASCEYQVGDLAWARVGTYPFWPCIVTREPFSEMFVKRKLFGRVMRAVVHVTFFGDNGRRGWIVDNMLRKYHGRDEFEASREKFSPEAKKKDPRLYAAYFVSEKKLPLWNKSVDEAETLMKEPKRLRIDALYDLLEKSRAAKTTPKREKGGKITRTNSDVSLSESLYDTLFSEDDGKTDDNSRTKKARNKSLDVSEVVTACLDNMAAKSGIIQIQRQSHMDRWLQKAKSKTPEKIQPKLQIKVEREKRKDKAKKKSKEGKKPHKIRKNESLGSDTNLLAYENEHDYSSVNYENHDLNDSSNKNTDSASGHDSTLDSSSIGVIVKVESLSSSMDDCSQDDIITTVVNDDIVMTEPENVSKDCNVHEEKKDTENTNDEIENNKRNPENSNINENIQIGIQVEPSMNNSDLTKQVQPRRSKRKRQTLEELNNSITENKAKELKLDVAEQKSNIEIATLNCRLEENQTEELSRKKNKVPENIVNEIECTEPSVSSLEVNTIHHIMLKSKELVTFNSNSKPVVVIEPLKMDDLETQVIDKKSKQLIQKKLLDGVANNSKVEKKRDIPDTSSGAVQMEIDTLESATSTSQETKILPVSITNAEKNTDILTQNTNEESKPDQDNVPNDCKPQTVESNSDSERIQINIPALPVTVEKENTDILTSSINSEANPYSNELLQTNIYNNTAKVVQLSLVPENRDTLDKEKDTNVVIGEETYKFDRTLSQDYDEIDGDRCDEVNNLPAVSSNEETENLSQNNLSSHDEFIPKENCKENNTKSKTENTEITQRSNDADITTKNDSVPSNKSRNDVTLNFFDYSKEQDQKESCPVVNEMSADVDNDSRRDCIFLDKGNKDNDVGIIKDDSTMSSITKDVSNTMNLEQIKVHNHITEENNAQCVFLDKSIEMTNAPLNDSKERKRKSPRLSLNKTKNHSPVLNNSINKLQSLNTDSLENSTKKLNADPDKGDLGTASINSDDSQLSISVRKGLPKAKQDSKKTINDPEFIKYLEIRQDALLDEQPDLTQDEIVTYLYQNWLYEEDNKSDMKKSDDTEQSNLVKGLNQDLAPNPKKNKKKLIEKESDTKSIDIRSMMIKENPELVSDKCENQDKQVISVHKLKYKNGMYDHINVPIEKFVSRIFESNDDENKLINTDTDVSKSIEITHKTCTNEFDSNNDNNPKDTFQSRVSGEFHKDSGNNVIKSLSDIAESIEAVNEVKSTHESDKLKDNDGISQEKVNETLENCVDITLTETRSIQLKKSDEIENSQKITNFEICLEKMTGEKENKMDIKESKESAVQKINNDLENKEIDSEIKAHDDIDPETASVNSEDSGVSLPRRRGRPKEKQVMNKAMEDPEFLKYLEARQDALIDEQPDLTQDEIVTYLFQTWFYEESNKSELKKTDDTEQSNLVKGLNVEAAPQPKKIKKKPKIEKEPGLKNIDIREMIQKEKPKRKITQSKPYYNEDDSDLEEEDLETFKIFDRNEQNEHGEEIDEVELYFEQLTKPKPNVFKGYVRERVCEICERTGDLVKCKNCHGTFHVNCVKKEAEIIEVAAPIRGRKKKRGRKPKGYDSLLDSGSQSDERSQDANNSEELNMSVEDETHLVIDADNFEAQWELKLKEIQTEYQEDYASDQEINWELEPGQCEIVDLKQKEKPIDYSDYKCNSCLKHDTPVCFVCKSNISPKGQTEVRQKCQVAHCHRYYHLECLDHWPQTQFNSWEPSKPNKKVVEYIEALSCPRHVCHTCVSDDPRGCKTRFCGDKLARCVRCPATYHSYTKCLPAGSQILTGSQIICPRHYEHRPGKVPCHVNTGWCFICALGGTLICCEYCPTSFHAECLNIKPPEGSYMCEDCETGRLPLYGEMVWVKLGHYRWWPGIVLHPTEIPDNIMAVKHSPGEFVVRFFGQYDHYWVNRGRVFPFQEGDSGRISSQKSKIDAAFTTAMEHAQRACEILKKMEPNEEEDMDIASSLLPPHYVKLKVNKPAGVARREIDANSLTQCDCDPSQPDPCGPYSHCLNRMLLTECGPLCRAGERCNNRAFERRLYPRLAAYRTPHRGWGLRALEDIKQGQFVIEYVGELIDMEEFRRRMCRKHEIRDENFYFLTLDKERMIDAGPKGNLARFMNHCCEPNCETQKWTVLGDVRVGLFALRDIPANSEVTFNYNLECAGIEKKRCLCGAKRCSGYIGAKPKQLQDDQPKKVKPPAKRTYKKRKPVEDSPTTSKTKAPKIKIKPIKPRELTEIEKDLLIIKNATNGMSSDSEGSRLSSVDEKNPKALKRKRVSFSTEDSSGKKVKLADDETATESTQA